MAELTLVSPCQRPIQPLVEGALENELLLLEAELQHSDQRLQACEARYGLSTVDCVPHSENKVLEKTLDFTEWVGNYHSSSGQSLYGDGTTVYHLHPHLVTSEQTHATEWLRVSRIRFYGADLPIP